MRMKLAFTTLMLVLSVVVAACGGSGAPGATTKPGGGATTKPAGGSVDCAAIKDAAVTLIGIQLLAQIRTPDTAESIMNKEIGNLDVDVMLAALATMHALDGYSSPLGDPKAAIEVYEKAAKAAKVLFETEPITQAAIDAYNVNVGDIATFLGHQVAIAGARDEAGC